MRLDAKEFFLNFNKELRWIEKRIKFDLPNIKSYGDTIEFDIGDGEVYKRSLKEISTDEDTFEEIVEILKNVLVYNVFIPGRMGTFTDFFKKDKIKTKKEHVHSRPYHSDTLAIRNPATTIICQNMNIWEMVGDENLFNEDLKYFNFRATPLEDYLNKYSREYQEVIEERKRCLTEMTVEEYSNYSPSENLLSIYGIDNNAFSLDKVEASATFDEMLKGKKLSQEELRMKDLKLNALKWFRRYMISATAKDMGHYSCDKHKDSFKTLEDASKNTAFPMLFHLSQVQWGSKLIAIPHKEEEGEIVRFRHSWECKKDTHMAFEYTVRKVKKEMVKTNFDFFITDSIEKTGNMAAMFKGGSDHTVKIGKPEVHDTLVAECKIYIYNTKAKSIHKAPFVFNRVFFAKDLICSKDWGSYYAATDGTLVTQKGCEMEYFANLLYGDKSCFEAGINQIDTVFFCASKYDNERQAILLDIRSESKRLFGSKKTVSDYHDLALKVVKTYMKEQKGRPELIFDFGKFDKNRSSQ